MENEKGGNKLGKIIGFTGNVSYSQCKNKIDSVIINKISKTSIVRYCDIH